MKGEKGFTLIEVIVVLAVVAVIVGALTPLIFQQLNTARERATKQEMEQIQEAILGNAEKGTFGYIGDMGRLPGSLEELIIQGDQPPPEAYINGITYGWGGPYISGFDKEALLTDAWGNTYVYDSVPPEVKDCHHGKRHAHHSHGHGKGHYHHEHGFDHGHYHDANCTDKKEPQGTGQLISLGPDGIKDTEDDLIFPVSPVSMVGNVYVTVHVQEDSGWITDPNDVAVYLSYADNGEESKHPLKNSSPPFVFEDVVMGFHAVEVSRKGEDHHDHDDDDDSEHHFKDTLQTITSPGGRQSSHVEIWVK